MFCADPPRAVAEARRVLKPGGRCGIATWAEPSSCPFFTVIGGVAAEHLGLRLPPGGAPGPFRFSSAAELADIVQAAGFRDVVVERLAMRFDCGFVEDYCGIFREVAWRARFDALSEAEIAAFRRDTAAAAGPYSENGRLRLTTVSLCARGTR
jgi:SAM-dependent methyltransferase